MTQPFVPTPITLVNRYDDGADACHFTFEFTEPAPSALVLPGQFFMLTVPGHGEAPFTYVEAPNAAGRFSALVRRVGNLTTALLELPVGAILGARGPFGRGWPAAALTADRVLVVAGGCGLAPLAPALDLLSAHEEPRRAVLIYGSRTPAQQVLKCERARWSDQLPIFEVFDHPTNPGDLKGTPLDFLGPALDELGAPPDYALVCGPETMMHRTAAALEATGVRRERIFLSIERRMHCGVGLCGHCYVANEYACKQGPTYRYDELTDLVSKSPPRAAAVTEIRHC